MSDEMIDVGVSVDVVAKVSGDICVELLRQYQNMQAVNENGEEVETSLDGVALMAHRLAVICCTGIVTPEAE